MSTITKIAGRGYREARTARRNLVRALNKAAFSPQGGLNNQRINTMYVAARLERVRRSPCMHGIVKQRLFSSALEMLHAVA